MTAHVLTFQPIIVSLWLETAYEGLHRDLNHVAAASANTSPLAVLDPTLRRKVGRLGAVEAMIEPGMVAEGNVIMISPASCVILL